MDLSRIRYGVRPISRFNFLSVCLCVRLCVRLSRVRGFRWLYMFVSVYVCNIPRLFALVLFVYIYVHVHIHVSILCIRTLYMGASILASDLDAVKNSIRRRFHTTIAMASWRGYANMLLGRIQYVGKAYAFNKVQRQYRLVEHLDQGAFGSWSCAHLMDRPLPDLHPSGWAY